MFKVEDGKIKTSVFTLPGVGGAAADSLQKRVTAQNIFQLKICNIKTKVTKAVIETLKDVGVLKDLPEATDVIILKELSK